MSDPLHDDDELAEFMSKLTISKKRKKAKKAVPSEAEVVKRYPDGDYTYTSMLEMVYDLVRQNNGNLMVRDAKKVFQIPHITRVKQFSVWTNFAAVATSMQRSAEILLGYMSKEMSLRQPTLRSNGSLYVRGPLKLNDVKAVLSKYAKNYLVCGQCKSTNTLQLKDPIVRINIIGCQKCGYKRPVDIIVFQ